MLLVLLALVPLAVRADQKDDLKKKGDAAAAAGRLFEARDAYCQLARMSPNDPQAKTMCSAMNDRAGQVVLLKNKGDVAATAGRLFEARDAYCQLARMYPNDPQAKMMCSALNDRADQVVLLKKKGDAAAAGTRFEARDAYCQLARMYPNDPQAKALCSAMNDRAVQENNLKKKGDAAAAAGRFYEARDAYCPLADMDPSYPQAKMLCSAMKREASNEYARCDTRFYEASKLLGQNKFADAQQTLKAIEPGCKRYDDAQQILAQLLTVKPLPVRIRGDFESIASLKLQEGKTAYSTNNFIAARVALSQVPGSSSKAGEALDLVNKIKQYQNAMAVGSELAQSRNIREAMAAFAKAQQIKADGPGKKMVERFLQDCLYDNSPTKMAVGKTERIQVGLDQRREPYAAKRFPGRGTEQVEQIGDGPLLTVVLKGSGFDIKALNDAEQRIEWDGHTLWAWNVTPTSPGKQSLAVEASLRLKPGLGEAARNRLLSVRVIDVQVTPASLTRRILLHYWHLWVAGALTIIVVVLVRARMSGSRRDGMAL
ncbi:MAG: hypothetical protein LAN37_15905 [Acidobacteriia bacterium]|nr:hypothetical protein [Terriglobia bacterium]